MDEQCVGLGDAVRSGPLSWAQHWPWQDQLKPPDRRSPSLLFFRTVPLPRAMSVAELAVAAQPVVERHESLRTTFGTAPDGSAVQIVWPASPVRYEIRELRAADSARWPRWQFDLGHEWPFRLALIHHDSGRTDLLVCAHHIAVDHAGMANLVADLTRTLDPDGRPAIAPGGHPLDFAALEESAAGLRAAHKAVAHWRRHEPDIRRVIAALSARLVPAGGPTSMYRVQLVSRVARKQLGQLAVELGRSEPTVLQGVVAYALARHLDLPALAMTTLGANRHLPGARDAVCTLAQSGLVRVAVDPDAPVHDAIRAGADATLAGYQHAHHNTRLTFTAFGDLLDPTFHRPVTLPSVSVVRVPGSYAPFGHGVQEHDAPRVRRIERPCTGFNTHLHLYDSTLDVDLRVGTHLTDEAGAVATVESIIRLLGS